MGRDVPVWLASVPHLSNEAVQRWGATFAKYGVDSNLLDMLASAEGSTILDAWRSERSQPQKQHSDQPAVREVNRIVEPAAPQLQHPPPTPAPPPTQQALQQQQEPQQQEEHQQLLLDLLRPDRGLDQLQEPAQPPQSSRQQQKRQMSQEQDEQQRQEPQLPSHGASGRRQRLSQEARQGGTHYFARAAGLASQPAPRRSRPTQELSPQTVGSSPSGIAQPPGRQLPLWKESTALVVASTPAAPAPLAESKQLAEGGTKRVGVLKSFNADTGWGFITSSCEDSDIFVRRSSLPADGLHIGREVEFERIFNNEGKPQAIRVAWTAGGGNSMIPQRFSGILKSLGDNFGFIECKATHDLYGRDVYVTRQQLPERALESNQTITFEVSLNKNGYPQAQSILVPPEEDANDAVSSERISRRKPAALLSDRGDLGARAAAAANDAAHEAPVDRAAAGHGDVRRELFPPQARRW